MVKLNRMRTGRVRKSYILNIVAIIFIVIAFTCVSGLLPNNLMLEQACADEFGSKEAEFLTLINEYRQQNGLRPLALSPTLTISSRLHSEDMAALNYFSHNSLDGRTPWDRIWDAGYTYNTTLSENIAAGFPTAAEVFEGWRNSPGHNANMLSPDFTAIGIGLDFNPYSTYGWYWTTDFGGYDDSNVIHPDGTLIKGLGPATYIIDGGKKRYIPSGQIFNSYKFRWQDVVTVPDYRLNSYQTGSPIGFREGMLVKGQNSPQIYVISDGQKCHIASATVFNALGYSWSNIISVPDAQLSYNTTGSDVASANLHPEGSLVKGENATIYLIDNQQRRPVTSPQAFLSRYNWIEVLPQTSQDEGSYAINESSPVSFRDGLLVRTPVFSTIYTLSNGQKKQIGNSQVFAALGYKWSNVITISTDFALNKYTNSTAIGFREGMLIKGQNSPQIYVISDGQKCHIASATVFNALGYNWSNIISVPDAQLSYNTTGPNITSVDTHPNGTLLKTQSSGDVYLIQNCQKRKIHCWNAFLSHRFRLQDVIMVTESKLNSYSTNQTPLGFRDGILVKEKGINKIYSISNGQKRHIVSQQIFEELGYQWSGVKEYTTNELAANLSGADISSVDTHPSGAIIKGTGSNVYQVQGSDKKLIPSSEVYNSQFFWSDIVDIRGYEISLFPLGDPIALNY